MRWCTPVLALVFLLCTPDVLPVAAQDNPKLVARELEKIIETGEVVIGLEDDDDRLVQVFTFYEERNYTPMWVRDSGPKHKAHDFLDVIKSSDGDGLVPEDYRVSDIEPRMSSRDPRALAELEILLTRGLLDFGRDMSAGRVEPNEVNSEVHVFPQSTGALNLLEGIEVADDIAPFVASLAPQTPRYDRLKVKLAELRQQAKMGGWTIVPDGETLKPGMRDARLPAIRQRLIEGGDLDPDSEVGDVYDGVIVAAVKNFQYRHGLDEDGVIGPATLAEMNVPIEHRIEQIRLNMERRRWMADDLGDPHVFVNLADQYLKVVKLEGDRERTTHTALTVVGKPYHRTPVFQETLEYLEFNPYWNVPPSIARNEFLPELKRDPGYLKRQNIRIFAASGEVDPYAVNWNAISGSVPYSMRQDPGPWNALGQVKFMFPNKFNVYIHDTPAKGLFSRSTRTFSHGCIRVQDPQELARVILGLDGMSREQVDAYFASPERRVVRLKRPIPVHITYLTAWVNKDMSVHFRKDIYGRDEQLAKALARSHRIVRN